MTNDSAAKPFGDSRFRADEIVARFGSALSPEQVEQVTERIKRTLSLSAALQSTPLTNADEPEIVFMPFRGPK